MVEAALAGEFHARRISDIDAFEPLRDVFQKQGFYCRGGQIEHVVHRQNGLDQIVFADYHKPA